MFAARRILLLTVTIMLTLEVCAVALEFPKIDRRPAAADWERGKLAAVACFDPNLANAFQVDLRCHDLPELDLKDRLSDLLHATFDDRTTWPPWNWPSITAPFRSWPRGR